MKLYNVICVWDMYVVAESEEAANAACKAAIDEKIVERAEENAIEIRHERGIRAVWVDQRPVVGADVSDADFESLKGKTTRQAFDLINGKEVKAPKAAP